MYSLDSSIFRLLYSENSNVTAKVLSTPIDQLYLSAVVIHEALGGRLSNLRTAQSDKSRDAAEKLAMAYAELFESLDLIQRFPRIPYTREDELEYRRLSPQIKRVGTQDCRIAVQAHRRGFIVVTQNVSDFEAVGIKCIDWSLNTTSD